MTGMYMCIFLFALVCVPSIYAWEPTTCNGPLVGLDKYVHTHIQ